LRRQTWRWRPGVMAVLLRCRRAHTIHPFPPHISRFCSYSFSGKGASNCLFNSLDDNFVLALYPTMLHVEGMHTIH
jgi:hypothetical protein